MLAAPDAIDHDISWREFDMSSTYPVVSDTEAKQSPYPYVYVYEDGAVRELHDSERRYLEQPFSPFDGGRPYVKDDYASDNGFGDTSGFCHRSKIPGHLRIGGVPVEDPVPRMSRPEFTESLKKPGWNVTQRRDGTIEMRRVRKGVMLRWLLLLSIAAAVMCAVVIAAL